MFMQSVRYPCSITEPEPDSVHTVTCMHHGEGIPGLDCIFSVNSEARHIYQSTLVYFRYISVLEQVD